MDSKERLLYEIHEDFLDGLLQEVTALTGSPRERFGAMISAHMADLAAHQRDIKVFFEEVKHIDAAQRELLFARRTTYASAVEGIIAEGVTSGEFEVPDVRLAVRGLLGAMNEAYRWYNPRGALSCAELSARLTDLFLFGIDATPPPAAAEISVAELDRRMAAPEAAAEADETPAERIVRCAAVLFAEHGYHATSTQEIADAAGITKGALFYHVSSKSGFLSGSTRTAPPATSTVFSPSTRPGPLGPVHGGRGRPRPDNRPAPARRLRPERGDEVPAA